MITRGLIYVSNFFLFELGINNLITDFNTVRECLFVEGLNKLKSDVSYIAAEKSHFPPKRYRHTDRQSQL